MPELPKKKPKSKKEIEELSKVLESLVKINNNQFQVLTDTLKASQFRELASLNFPINPIADAIKNIQFPKLSNSFPDLTTPFEEREPVNLDDFEFEDEKQSKEDYLIDLHIRLLEQQLNLVKGIETPQYDMGTGVITFMGKSIQIPLDTNLEMVCRVVLKNVRNMKRKWSWDELVEAERINIQEFTARKIYTAVRSINDKIAKETQAKDFLLANPTSTVQLNPQFLAK